MKVQYKVNPQTIIEQEVGNQKDAFQFLAEVNEVFGESQCGKCDSTDLKFVTREAAKGTQVFRFYEVHCKKCFARLQYGQHSTGETLFPKRQDEDKNWLPNRGWSSKYVKPSDN